ncbi:hypothetical protein Ato02nite_021700 [Paractinoplanes toevensis]|uniref:Uncharacterized protein n=1 Tax=Paractinoplanes toevensis TaxID=571911 RepID=A0A919VZQ1_9ACTN|nr:hypothetical protein Ato02nite_021700 [Actinoplanes toevensis]
MIYFGSALTRENAIPIERMASYDWCRNGRGARVCKLVRVAGRCGVSAGFGGVGKSISLRIG